MAQQWIHTRALCSFIGQLKYEDPNVPDANATAQVDLPGVIKVFTGRNYELFSTIGAPPEGEASRAADTQQLTSCNLTCTHLATSPVHMVHMVLYS